MCSTRDQTGGETALQQNKIIDASAQAKSVSMNLAQHGCQGPHKQVNDLH